ncbi:MAG: VanZ family protein [Clostridia bacterium]|nr:VanZ family protein [Clostridia bacterium]
MKKLRNLLPRALFILYLAVLLRLTVFRAGMLHNGLFSGRMNLPVFTAYGQLLSWGSYFHAFYLFVGNIVWFVPLGWFLSREGFPFLPALLTGFLLSLAIESLQFVFGCGITETDDLILNTLGTACGVLLCILFQRGKKH